MALCQRELSASRPGRLSVGICSFCVSQWMADWGSPRNGLNNHFAIDKKISCTSRRRITWFLDLVEGLVVVRETGVNVQGTGFGGRQRRTSKQSVSEFINIRYLDPLQFDSKPHIHNSIKNLQYILSFTTDIVVDRGSTVVKASCYKFGGRWFDCRWCHWKFSLT